MINEDIKEDKGS